MDSRKGAASGFSGGKHAAGDKEGSVPSRWKGRNGENASYAAVRLSEGAWWLKQDKQAQQGSRPTHMQHSRQQSRSRKTTLSEHCLSKQPKTLGLLELVMLAPCTLSVPEAVHAHVQPGILVGKVCTVSSTLWAGCTVLLIVRWAALSAASAFCSWLM